MLLSYWGGLFTGAKMFSFREGNHQKHLHWLFTAEPRGDQDFVIPGHTVLWMELKGLPRVWGQGWVASVCSFWLSFERFGFLLSSLRNSQFSPQLSCVFVKKWVERTTPTGQRPSNFFYGGAWRRHILSIHFATHHFLVIRNLSLYGRKSNGTPKSSISIEFSIRYKPSILGYPYFRKHQYIRHAGEPVLHFQICSMAPFTWENSRPAPVRPEDYFRYRRMAQYNLPTEQRTLLFNFHGAWVKKNIGAWFFD